MLRKATREKVKLVIAQLREMKLKEAAKKVQDIVEETLAYCGFHYEYWTRICTNKVIERLNREIRCRRGWWFFPRWQFYPYASPRPPLPCDWSPRGQQEVHEYEVPGGCLYCWLTSFSRGVQTFLRATIDTTDSNPH